MAEHLDRADVAVDPARRAGRERQLHRAADDLEPQLAEQRHLIG